MEKIKNLIKKFWSRNFLVYLGVGIVATASSTALLWLFVDVLKVWVVYANIVITIFIFLAKYLMYDAGAMLSDEKQRLNARG